MTANDFYNPYLDMIKLSTISPSEFAESIKKWQLNSSNETYSGLSEDSLKPMAGDLFFPVKLKTNRFRNFIGSIYSDSLLFNEANELKSISLVFNLDAKIQLFNQAVTQRYSANFDPQKIKNPYAVNSVAYFSDSKKRLCFDGPFENERNHHTIRCLWVGQNSVAE